MKHKNIDWNFEMLQSEVYRNMLHEAGSLSYDRVEELIRDNKTLFALLLFLSFSLQSATGLSDIMPMTPAARILAMLQMFCGVMYLALIVSRLIALQYIRHDPRHNNE